MKDNLQHLFRDRFQGHEAAVDPGAWQAIQGQLAAAAPAADGLNDLFRERFAEHEMEVDPSVWQGVSTQLGHTAAAGAGASATVWGWVAAATGAVVITAAALLWNNEQSATETAALPQGQVTEVTAPTVDERTGTSGSTVPPGSAETKAAIQNDAVAGPATNGATVDRVWGSDGSMADASRTDVPAEPWVVEPGTADMAATGSPQVVNGPDKVEQIIEALAEQAKVVTPEPRSVVVPERTAPDPEEGLLEEQEQQRAEQPKLFMPNVFTPNNDGINDTYQVVGDGFAKVLVKVFAMKNNQLVFSTHSGEAWTGANCEDGMYLVAVEALTPDGRSVTEGKVVWLNRTPMN
ncbi:MAG: gliding motility-associated C-terminal domain-containing protein [Flavobacteriales bacterium]